MKTPFSSKHLSVCASAVLLLALCTTTRAETVLDNLGAPNFNTAQGGQQVGGAIQIGDTPITISTVEFHQWFTGGYVFPPGQTFAIYSRNADGTVGTPLFTDFTLIHGGDTLITRASANSAYVLQANTAYWLVLTTPPSAEFVLWNYTPSPNYTSALGVTIPALRASFYREKGENFYFALEEGPQELRVTGYSAAAPAPVPQRVVSRKRHGGAGDYDIDLPLTGAVGIECRSGGPGMDHQLVFFFPSPVTIETATVTSGTGNVTSSAVVAEPGGAGTQVTVNLAGVADAQRLAVKLSGVTDGNGIGDFIIRVGVLLGDTTGNGVVSASDIGDAKAQSGQPLTTANFRTDVTANGSINASDMGVVKSRAGATLPAGRGGAAEAR